MLCLFCFSHRNFGCFHLVCLIVPSTFVIFTIGITVICNIICLWMGNLYAATPGQNPGVARIYIYISHCVSPGQLKAANSWLTITLSETCCQTSRVIDTMDCLTAETLHYRRLCSPVACCPIRPRKHISLPSMQSHPVTGCSDCMWLLIIAVPSFECKEVKLEKKCAYSRLPKMSSCSQCGIKIQFAKEWRHAASWKSWNMKHLKSERIWGVKEQWNYVKFAGITPGVPPVYWWRVTQRTTGEQHGTTCWTT